MIYCFKLSENVSRFNQSSTMVGYKERWNKHQPNTWQTWFYNLVMLKSWKQRRQEAALLAACSNRWATHVCCKLGVQTLVVQKYHALYLKQPVCQTLLRNMSKIRCSADHDNNITKMFQAVMRYVSQPLVMFFYQLLCKSQYDVFLHTLLVYVLHCLICII